MPTTSVGSAKDIVVKYPGAKRKTSARRKSRRKSPGVLSRITASVQRRIADVQAFHARQVQAAEDRARAKIARATTKLERERARTELKIEKLRLQTALSKEKAVLVRQKTALGKARREAGYIPFGERITGGIARASKTLQSFQTPVSKSAVKKPKKKQSINDMLWG